MNATQFNKSKEAENVCSCFMHGYLDFIFIIYFRCFCSGPTVQFTAKSLLSKIKKYSYAKWKKKKLIDKIKLVKVIFWLLGSLCGTLVDCYFSVLFFFVCQGGNWILKIINNNFAFVKWILLQVLNDLVQGEFMQLGAKETENERFTHYFTKTYRKTASLIANSLKAVSIYYYYYY